MTADARLLVGSLSNDLFRVATLTQRGSLSAATRFLTEAQRWAEPLIEQPVDGYIVEIARDVTKRKEDELSLELAERYLMYGVLLQNYALHNA